jgi:hypothetical protein
VIFAAMRRTSSLLFFNGPRWESAGDYLYHLDAMQGVSFPDLNKNATTQTIAPPCKKTPIPGVPEPDLCEARDF